MYLVGILKSELFQEGGAYPMWGHDQSLRNAGLIEACFIYFTNIS